MIFFSFFYDFFFGANVPIVSGIRKKIISRLDLKKGQKILEVAIGTGANVPFIKEKVGDGEIHGIDISKKMLEKCSKKYPYTTLVLGSAEKLPYQDNYFDAVLFFISIKFVKNKNKAISEVIRVAKPGAKILIGDEYPFLNFEVPKNVKGLNEFRIDIFHIKEFYK